MPFMKKKKKKLRGLPQDVSDVLIQASCHISLEMPESNSMSILHSGISKKISSCSFSQQRKQQKPEDKLD